MRDLARDDRRARSRTQMNKIRLGFFSFTEITDPNEHHSYNEWHQLDHMPEQYPLDGIAYGQRWVSTPACRAARSVSEPLLDPVHYMTLYLMTEPVERTLREFMQLGRDLHAVGRFHLHRQARLSGPFPFRAADVAPRVLISAEAVPYRPNLGVYVEVEEIGGDERRAIRLEHLGALCAVPGVAGCVVVRRRRAPGDRDLARRAAARHVRTARTDRGAAPDGVTGTHGLRRSAGDDHALAVGLVRPRLNPPGVARCVSQPMRRRIGKTSWVWGSSLGLAGAVVRRVRRRSSSHTTAPPVDDADNGQGPRMRSSSAADFTNINSMTRVGDHFVTNVKGHLAAALAVAHSAKGGVYPVGTIIQLVPQEAMVKRAPGFSPSTDDWEFFSLDVSAKGTRILSRGGVKVLNRFGGSCASCHSAAKSAVRLRVRHQPRLRAAPDRTRRHRVTAEERSPPERLSKEHRNSPCSIKVISIVSNTCSGSWTRSKKAFASTKPPSPGCL